MRVFIVEDSPEIRERLRTMMAVIKNIELVGEVDNEADAVRSIYSVRPDALILDLTLVSGSGLGVLRKISEKLASMWVIVLTNYAFPQYEKRCTEMGADYFLDKSRDIEKLGFLLAELASGSGRGLGFKEAIKRQIK
jgi:DNA-binding NarL/FixJ family response regulator